MARRKWRAETAGGVLISLLLVTSLWMGTRSIEEGFRFMMTSQEEKKIPRVLSAGKESIQNATMHFLAERRQAYAAAGMGFQLRGIGYMDTVHQMAVAVTDVVRTNSGLRVRMRNVHTAAAAAVSDDKDCRQLSIWVRVAGPEIVAGLAHAVVVADRGGCTWEYQARIGVPGNYTIVAKLLSWGAVGGIEPETMRCPVVQQKSKDVNKVLLPSSDPVAIDWEMASLEKSNDHREDPPTLLDTYPRHAGFKGFKVYHPLPSCCEYCSRLPGCKYWATPPLKMQNPSWNSNGCEFFFARNQSFVPQSYLLHDVQNSFSTTQVFRRRRRRLQGDSKNKDITYHVGKAHEGRKVWFVGCGWSQWFTLDFPCLSGELDDQVYIRPQDRTFQLSPKPQSSVAVPPVATNASLPLCQLAKEHVGTVKGRWVREPWPVTQCPRFRFDKKIKHRFDITEWTGENPHCWHRDDLTRVGHACVEMNCQFIHKSSKWVSPLREKQFMGVWRDRKCDLLEFTDTQLQQCFQKAKIAKFIVSGKSISDYLGCYLEQRLGNVRLYDNPSDRNGHVTVNLDTLALLHKAGLDTDQLISFFDTLPVANQTYRVFVPDTMFISSERETFAIQEHTNRWDRLAREHLQPKGYSFLNIREASTTWTYDTATQFDGMHLIGPPLKLAITKMFHFLCKDHVEGSRM